MTDDNPAAGDHQVKIPATALEMTSLLFENVSNFLLSEKHNAGVSPASGLSQASGPAQPIGMSQLRALGSLLPHRGDSDSSSSEEESSESSENVHRRQFTHNVLKNITRDENYENIGLTILSKVFMQYGENERKLEELCTKYPGGVAKFLSLVFRNCLGRIASPRGATSGSASITSGKSSSTISTPMDSSSGGNSMGPVAEEGSSSSSDRSCGVVNSSVHTGASSSSTSDGSGKGFWSKSELFLVEQMRERRDRTVKSILGETQGKRKLEEDEMNEEAERFAAKRSKLVPRALMQPNDIEDQKLLEKIRRGG